MQFVQLFYCLLPARYDNLNNFIRNSKLQVGSLYIATWLTVYKTDFMLNTTDVIEIDAILKFMSRVDFMPS